MQTFWRWNRTRTEDIWRICRGCGRGVAVRYALLALATATALAQEPALAADPPVRLTGTGYALYSRAYTFLPDQWHTADQVPGAVYFGAVGVEDNRPAGAGELAFALEVEHGAAHPYCRREDACDDLLLGVRPHTGQLYLYADVPPGENWRRHFVELPVADFESQRAEVSVADEATGLKVYREIVVEPPAGGRDCGGYAAADADRFTCLFLREELAAAPREVPASVRAALPVLVQPPENYRLVLSEEFDVADADLSQGCENRLAGLDTGVWNYASNPCDNVDADNVPCLNVEDGHLTLGKSGACGSGDVTTTGKFYYRYGYVETRVTMTIRPETDFYTNSVIVANGGGRRTPLHFLYGRYGIEVEGPEAAGKYLGAEMDLVEYVPRNGRGSLNIHQYVNATLYADGGAFANHPGVPPKRSDAIVDLCRRTWSNTVLRPPGVCEDGGEVTATLGLEWTPRGYLNWLKIDGLHDDFILLDRRKTSLRYRRWISSDRTFGNRWYHLDLVAGLREAWGTWTVGGRRLEVRAWALAHVPANLSMVAWGYPDSDDTRIQTRLKVDYIRVFQPVNRYRDMEPVYN